MEYYISYSTDPQEKIYEIQAFIQGLNLDFVRTKVQRNPHDFGSYESLEIFWENSFEFHELQDVLDAPEENDKRFEELDAELDRLNKLEEEISEKFNKFL